VEVEIDDESGDAVSHNVSHKALAALADPDERTERALLADSIAKAVQHLSPGARTVFTLHDIEGYTHEEIARELGITPGGSKSQLFKARAKLRRLLAHLEPSAPSAGSAHVTPLSPTL
jgi:RNA polymerase sigma-70 factor (ECF subfamily)